ncbi:MAG: TM0106 family RecB-like putative nuclease [Coleofasciculaceae cyanobacterium]
MLLTEDLLLDYKRCRRRAFLEVYGNPTQQDQKSEFLLKLQKDSRLHRQAVFAHFAYERPKYAWRDWQAAAQATLELMQGGAQSIKDAVLLMPTSQGVTLLTRPDLLVKQPGQSIFGDWIYSPTIIKLGRRPKAEYKILAAFSSQILAAVQGVWPTTAELILRRPHPYQVDLEAWLPPMQEVLAECIDTLLLKQEPEVFISRQKCSLCHWHSHCYAIAQQEKHLSLLPGVTPNRYQDLQTLGLTTVESLAESSITAFETILEPEVALELVLQAQSTVQNRALLRQPISPGAIWEDDHNCKTSPLIPTDTIPTSLIELYFDIEAEPDLHVDYLFGVLVIDRLNQTEAFYNLLAENPREEESIWYEFLALVELYPDAPIFHFSDYEAETVKRLAKLYKTPQREIKPLLRRFVDLHQQVANHVKLPVESYSLKNLARWLGFEWRDTNVTGSQTVCLYNQWLQTGDRSLLAAVERYNEDDCRATYKLKDWLVSFLQNAATL